MTISKEPAFAKGDHLMGKTARLPFIQADYAGYPATVEKLKLAYLDYPRCVSIETSVKCNAKCSFCPYPTSPRQGQEIPDELFHKIIEDLRCIPRNHAFWITLCRINEPLLDRRLQGFCQVIADELPSAIQQFWTNGSMLNEGAFEWMTQYSGASLAVSLNSVNEEEHVKMMGFGLQKVSRGLDYLHRLAESGQFTLPVALCAPYQDERQATDYQAACTTRWPLFSPAIRPYFQWMGESRAGAEHRLAYGLPTLDAGRPAMFACGQWFDLHVLANGYVTKCCIDETGHAGDAAFDIRKQSVMDIYQSSRDRREELPARATVSGCNRCLHLG